MIDPQPGNCACAHQLEKQAVNGIENFWSLLKRTLKGTYVSVDPAHLQAYVDEQCYRFNQRKLTDQERFVGMMKQIVGRRLTYKELTGQLETEPG